MESFAQQTRRVISAIESLARRVRRLETQTFTTIASAFHVVIRKNSGSDVGQQPRLNLIEGHNITLDITDDPVNSEVDILISSTGHTIQDEGVSLPDRDYLDFVGDGVTVTDSSVNNKTIVEILSLANLNKILVYHRNGDPVEWFEPDDIGWDLAAAACNDWDTIVSPPASYSLVHTVPANVTYRGHGPSPTLHTATLTYLSGSVGMDHIIIVSVNNAGEAVGIVGPDTGTAWLNRVSIGVTQAGAGDATGIKAGAGTLILRDVPTEATAQGAGMAAAVYNGSGRTECYECVLEGTSTSGLGYGTYNDGGVVQLIGGSRTGSTAPGVDV